MNSEELIMNNEQLPVGAAWHAAQKHTDKNNIMHVGAGPLVSAQENKSKKHTTSVGACIARPSGITLIALIITIIVMLILAGVVLNLTIGERGIFKTAKGAVKNYTNASEKEIAELDNFDKELENRLSGTVQTGAGTGGEESAGGDKETDGSWNNVSKVNTPKLTGTGLIPVTIAEDGTTVTANTKNDDWYSYVDTSLSGKENTSRWANAVTKNTSGEITGYFVWIPRYAYKITYNNESDKSAGGTIDVVFLKGTTNKDENGNDVTSSKYVDEKGNTGAYIVHPAFCDESQSGYQNGGWDSELTGFWVAKFEAGFMGRSRAVDSNITCNEINGGDTKAINYDAVKMGDKLKYPAFKANLPSMNKINICDAYDLCLDIKNGTSVYGLSNVDSHMMKNSEWGAVAYLTHSKYGINGERVTINAVIDPEDSRVGTVTGYSTYTGFEPDTSRSLSTLMKEGQDESWTRSKSQSNTGNIYGIFDLSGGVLEWTAGYLDPGKSVGGNSNMTGDSTRYKNNYKESPFLETTRVGEALWETKLWNKDLGQALSSNKPFLVRGGYAYSRERAGLFNFGSDSGFTNVIGGGANYWIGFRAVLVAE